MKNHPFSWLAFLTLISLLSACGNREFTQGKYDDISQDRLLDDKFNETDMRRLTDTLISSLEGSRIVQTAKKAPVVMVKLVKNRTEEHIDMKSMSDIIKVALSRSGKLRFTESEVRGEMSDEMQYQSDSGNVDPNTAKRKRKQIGADYFLTGEITDRVQEVGSKKYVYYKCTFNLVNLETGILDWTDQAEVRKYYTKKSVGF